jgi:glycosyltransferase involved in cell wall biosynthesis
MSGHRVLRTVLVAHPGAELYGSDRVLLESVSALIDDGWRVVVTVPTQGPLLDELRERGATIAACVSPVLRKSALRPRGMLRLIRATTRGLRDGSRLISRERPSVMYVNTMTIPLWLVLARLRGIPVLCHVHEGEASASRLTRAVLTLPLFLARAIVANSKFSVSVLERTFRRLRQRTKVVYNAVSGPPSRQPARRHLDGGVHLTYVGRLSPRKGVDVAIDALAVLADRGVSADLDVVGAVFPGYEWYEKQLRDQVKAKKLGGHVHFHGFQPSVWELVNAGDVVVVPSRIDEPFGNTAVEAILSGRPVVASATSGLLEATAGYASATTVAPGSATALADALQSTIDGWEVRTVAANRDVHTAEARHSSTGYRVRIAGIVRTVSSRTRSHP